MERGKENSKEALAQKVKSLGNAALWPYPSGQETLPDWLIAKWIMIYGNDEDYRALRAIFSIDYLKKVWFDKIARSDFFDSYNERICRNLFDIQNPSEYVQKVRQESFGRSPRKE